MKKSTLLSLLTATSIVLTSAGTYALWDTTSVNPEATVTFRNPVTVTVAEGYELTQNETTSLGGTLQASGTANFTVSNKNNLADKLTIVPTITGADGVNASDFNFTISEKDGKLTQVTPENILDGLTTTKVLGTDENYTVNVTVTPRDGLEEDKKATIASEQVKIQLTATLSKSQES